MMSFYRCFRIDWKAANYKPAAGATPNKIAVGKIIGQLLLETAARGNLVILTSIQIEISWPHFSVGRGYLKAPA